MINNVGELNDRENPMSKSLDCIRLDELVNETIECHSEFSNLMLNYYQTNLLLLKFSSELIQYQN